MEKIKDLLKKYSYLKGVAYFIIILLVSHYLWKFSFIEGKDLRGLPQIFLWRNFDLSYIFNNAVGFLSSQVYWLIHDVFNMDVVMLKNSVYLKEISSLVKIVWSCSGLKQIFVFLCIIAFYPGSEKHKLWFIPLGLFCVYLINVSRLLLLTYIVRDNPEAFDFWHGGVTKYAFYGIIFLIWVLWNDYLLPRISHIKKVSD